MKLPKLKLKCIQCGRLLARRTVHLSLKARADLPAILIPMVIRESPSLSPPGWVDLTIWDGSVGVCGDNRFCTGRCAERWARLHTPRPVAHAKEAAIDQAIDETRKAQAALLERDRERYRAQNQWDVAKQMNEARSKMGLNVSFPDGTAK